MSTTVLSLQEILAMAEKAIPHTILFAMHDSRDGTSYYEVDDYEGVYQKICDPWNLKEYTLEDIDRIMNDSGIIRFGTENDEELIFSSDTHAETFIEFLHEKFSS